MTISNAQGSMLDGLRYRSIEDIVSHHLGSLREILGEAEGNRSLDSFVERAARQIESNDCEELENQSRAYLMQGGGESAFYPLHMAVLYLHLALHLKAQSRHDEAWASLAEGAYWVGRATIETPRKEHRTQYDWLQIARKGGQNRADQYRERYAAAAAKIMELAPADGWKNADQAIEAVKVEVFALLKELLQFSVSPESQTQRLKQWYYHQGPIKQAIESNLRKNKLAHANRSS